MENDKVMQEENLYRQYEFEFNRFSMLNQKASFVLGFGSLVVAILLSTYEFAAEILLYPLPQMLLVFGIVAFLLADVISLFIIMPRHLTVDFSDANSVRAMTLKIEEKNNTFAKLLEFALSTMLFGIIATSFSLFSLLFMDELLAYLGLALSIVISAVFYFISKR